MEFFSLYYNRWKSWVFFRQTLKVYAKNWQNHKDNTRLLWFSKREYQIIFFFFNIKLFSNNNTNNMVNSSLKTFVFNSNSLLKTIFTFFTWLSIFRAGTISWGTTFHTISETFVFHFLAAFFANITFLALASSRFDACCKWTTPPFTNCCNENKILVKIN